MYNMGLAHYGMRTKGNVVRQTAADWFQNALKSQPALSLDERADVNFRLGDLYFDLNKPGPAAAAYAAATTHGEEIEKQGGKAPDWLTETYYKLGQIYDGQNDKPAQKQAWVRYLARNPAPGIRKTTAEQAIRTELQRF